MQSARKYVLTIAGFDPSSGAGLTADIKTLEQHKVYGLSICTAITLQTEDNFIGIRWEKINDVITSLNTLLNKYNIEVIKIGIVPSFEFLKVIVTYINNFNSKIKIIIDPILKSSTDFSFYETKNKLDFYELLKKCYLITPNTKEIIAITQQENPAIAAKEMSEFCNVYLKGGHNKQNVGVDYLYSNNQVQEIKPSSKKIFQKHGSGCILSSAIAANIALGNSLEQSCKKAKEYIETILSSNETLLAYHHV